MNIAATSLPLDTLARRLAGRLIRRGNADFDAARAVFYGGIDRRPAAIARVAHAADVAAAVAFARDHGLELAVRSGGHSVAGHSATEGGLVIDLRDMSAIEIDAESRTAWAGTGATAGAFTIAAAEHGLAVGFGDTGSVGIGGITLGGGVGFLARKHGLTIDSLIAAEVVTADGSVVYADAKTHSDLFWALRGGGGNFGVATRLRFRLHALTDFTGGMLILPATPATIAGFVATADEAPDALSTIANVMPAPPMPFLPAALHGALVIFAQLAFAGPPEEAAAALEPFRALATPHADMVTPMPYAGMFPPEEGGYHPTAVAQTIFLDHVGRDEAALMLGRLAASDAPMRVVQLRVLGGAVARVANDATAYAHRHSRIMANVASFYTGPDRASREAWVAALAGALRQGDDGAYVNFLADEGAARVRAAYPGGAFERLQRIKAVYDPDNFFHLNQNIPPAE
ncbi:MAG: FAD-binding oxidoreductase [Bauldia sp.]|nr:FAD-binding oxidoreductase [Bauldia sp.]